MSYRLWPAQVTVLSVVSVLGLLARPKPIDPALVDELAATFAFTRLAVPSTSTPPDINVHPVNPQVEHIARWLSSVGTSATLGDLDEDGVSNDLCRVEPRTGEVIVSPAPGSTDRYPAFVLQTDPPMDPHTYVATGCKFGDFNEDGLADLLVHYVGRTPLLFLRRAPPPAEVPAVVEGAEPVEGDVPAEGAEPVEVADPVEAPSAALPMPSLAAYRVQELLPDVPWWTSTVMITDVDGDGHTDLVMGNYFPDGLKIFGAAADGPVIMHESFGNARNGGVNLVFLWEAGEAGTEPTARFRQVPDPFEPGEARAWTLAMGAADLDGDGLAELYFANDFGPDQLYANLSTPGSVKLQRVKGKRDATTPVSRIMGMDSFKGMGVDFGDVNDDGKFDLFVSNITEHGGLEEGHFLFLSEGDMSRLKLGESPYVDRGEGLGVGRSSWGWDTRFADFDLDGDLELLQATGFLKGDLNWWADLAELANSNDLAVSDPGNWPNFPENIDISGRKPEPFYTKGPDGRYVNLAKPLGFDNEYNARGFTVGDVDADGDPDLVLANQWEDSWLFRNDQANGNAFLGLHLRLPTTPGELSAVEGVSSGVGSWPAIGAQATVTLPDGRTLIRQVDASSGHSGAPAAEMLFGLGKVDTKLPVHLRWRDRQGEVREADLTLSPGWHTLTLSTR